MVRILFEQAVETFGHYTGSFIYEYMSLLPNIRWVPRISKKNTGNPVENRQHTQTGNS